MDAITEKMFKVFKQGGGYARTNDIIKAGIYNIYLNDLLKNGQIEKIKRGLYRWVGMNESGNQGMLDVSKAIPGGVICLLSALAFYNLTTVKPMEVSIAVSSKRKVVIPEYPPVKLYYYNDAIFNNGKVEQRIGNNSFLIYDKEKTLCDCVKYRNQIGMDVIKEALHEYLSHNSRNLELLMKYSEICKVKPVMKNYLEVMV